MKNKKFKRALVTGGAGFIGSHLCEELLDQGIHVTALDNISTGSLSNFNHLLRRKPNFRFVRGSIMNRKLMKQEIKKCDVVFHLAAAVGVKYILDNPVQSILTNVSGTEDVLRYANQYRKKVLIASSSEIYGNQPARAIKEDDNRIFGPTSVHRWSYADAKALDEFLAFAYHLENGLEVIVLRFFNVTGPRQVGKYGMVLPRFVKDALSGKPLTIYGDGNQIRSFTHVKDAVSAVIKLSTTKAAIGKAFNVGNQKSISIKQLAGRVKKILNSKSKIAYHPYKKYYGENFQDVRYRICDISRLRKLIGYHPRFNVDHIIKDISQHFNQNGLRE